MSNFYALIGHPLSHSLSPIIHRSLFDISGRGDFSYELRDFSPDTLYERLTALMHEVGGLNVTIPHKQAIIPFLDGLHGDAAVYGAVNTVAAENGQFYGYNTDGEGFLYALKAGGLVLRGRVAVLGAGGAGRTCAIEAARKGCDVVCVCRNAAAGEQLVRDIHMMVPGASCAHTARFEDVQGDIDLLVNATPCGMFPHCDDSPVDSAQLARVGTLLDLIYNPARTMLMQLAEEAGVRTAGGMPMLVAQAAAAHRIWFGTEFSDDDISKVIIHASLALNHGRNIVLCGFMGCGKSTVGKLAGEISGQAFTDMDEYISEQAGGRSVAEIFADEGEDGFRRRERDACVQLAAQSGLIIATGGGCVINPENRRILAQSGVIVFIDSPLDIIISRLEGDDSRPMLKTHSISQLYHTRREIYRKAADIIINGSSSEEIARQITAQFAAQ